MFNITYTDFIGFSIKEDTLERFKQDLFQLLQENSIEVRCIDGVNFYFTKTKDQEYDYTLSLSFDIGINDEPFVRYGVHTYKKMREGYEKVKIIWHHDGPHCNIDNDAVLFGTEDVSELMKLLKTLVK